MAIRYSLRALLVFAFGSAAATYCGEECDNQGAVHLVQTKVGRAKKHDAQGVEDPYLDQLNSIITEIEESVTQVANTVNDTAPELVSQITSATAMLKTSLSAVPNLLNAASWVPGSKSMIKSANDVVDTINSTLDKTSTEVSALPATVSKEIGKLNSTIMKTIEQLQTQVDKLREVSDKLPMSASLLQSASSAETELQVRASRRLTKASTTSVELALLQKGGTPCATADSEIQKADKTIATLSEQIAPLAENCSSILVKFCTTAKDALQQLNETSTYAIGNASSVMSDSITSSLTSGLNSAISASMSAIDTVHEAANVTLKTAIAQLPQYVEKLNATVASMSGEVATVCDKS